MTAKIKERKRHETYLCCLCLLVFMLVILSCKLRKKLHHPAPCILPRVDPRSHEIGWCREGLGTADITLCRDATSKTEKRLSIKAWHSKFHHSYLPQGTAFPSAQPLSSLALPWAPSTLPVCIFHIPLAYKRDINTFLAWHLGETVCPRDEIVLPTLPKWITVHHHEEMQATHRKKHSQGIKMRCGSWNWNWEYLVWMAGFNLHLWKQQ